MIVRTKKNHNYSVINNTVLRDERLSWRARGIAAYLLSMPDDWSIDHQYLWKHGTEGRDAVLNAMKELEDHGYLVRERTQSKDGKFTTDVTLYEEPQPSPENQKSVNQKSVNQVSVNQDSIISTNDQVLITNTSNDDDRTRARGEIIKAYQENIGVIAPLVGEQLHALMDEVGQLSVMAGILAAANQNKRSFAYMQKCARNHASGIEKPAARATTTNGQGKDRIHEAAEASRKMLIAAGKEHLL